MGPLAIEVGKSVLTGLVVNAAVSAFGGDKKKQENLKKWQNGRYTG